jgi:hypothetical protein
VCTGQILDSEIWIACSPRKTVQGGNTFSKKLATLGSIVTLNYSSIADTNDLAAR